MRRKDLLIIISSVIILAFIIVCAMYYALNRYEITQEVAENIADNNEKIKSYHSNGWDKEIVDKVKYGIPVPVGFTYEEGKKENGLIIKDNKTQEKYMWIPLDTADEIGYEDLNTETKLEKSSKEGIENIQKYNGFYLAIDEKTIDEKFEDYLKENISDYNEILRLKKLGYEAYKKAYEEQTGEEFDLNDISKISEEKYRKLKLENDIKTETVETHIITLEEAEIIKKWEEKTGKEINFNNYKVLTVLGESVENEEDEKITEEEKQKIVNYEKDADGIEVPIPIGFEYEEGTVKTGFKIKNGDNLTFIWIPVNLTEEDKEKELGDIVRSRFIEEAEKAGAGDKLSTKEYENYTDVNEGNIAEYDELVESIIEYDGFYISEAEMGYDENGASINTYRPMIGNYVSNGDYYRNIKSENEQTDKHYDKYGNITKFGEKQSFELTYEEAERICKELYNDSQTAESHLMYGLEYDLTVLYLLEQGEIDPYKLFNNSTEIGKYSNSDKELLWGQEYSLNGIYGLGGNLAEITQEKDEDGNIIIRGGDWNTSGNVESIAVKTTKTKEEIADNEMTGEDDHKDTIGFRAALSIKTEYDESVELIEKKNTAKTELQEYIQGMGIFLAEGEENYFNNSIDENTKEYKMNLLNGIVEYINLIIDNETSSAALDRIVQDGKEEVDKIVENIIYIIYYPLEIHNYTYGDTYLDCWNIKLEGIELFNKLTWENGEITSYSEIIKQVKDKITEVRNKYRTQKITEYIDNYPTAADKDYTKIIKERAKEVLNITEDLDDIFRLAEEYRGIIELVYSLENTQIEEVVLEIKNKYIYKIANEAITKEDALSLVNQALEEMQIKLTVAEEERKVNEIIIALDVGHGVGGDRGAVYNGLVELTLNEETYVYVVEYLKQYEYITVVRCDRGDNIYVRTNSAREAGANMHISIHHNAGRGTGVETLYKSSADSESVKLAQILANTMSSSTGLRNRGAKYRSDLGIISTTQNIGCPSVCVEGGFVDNNTDRTLLLTHSGRKKVAAGITAGILQYFGIEDKGYPEIADVIVD